MRKATDPKPARNGWPFVTASVPDGPSMVFKIPTVPSRRAMVLDAYIKGSIRAADQFKIIETAKGKAGEGDDDAWAGVDVEAVTARGLLYVEGSVGRFLAELWWPVDAEFDAVSKFEDGGYSGPDARYEMGRDVVSELAEDLLLTWDEIASIARKLSETMKADPVDPHKVSEVETFFGLRQDK